MLADVLRPLKRLGAGVPVSPLFITVTAPTPLVGAP